MFRRRATYSYIVYVKRFKLPCRFDRETPVIYDVLRAIRNPKGICTMQENSCREVTLDLSWSSLLISTSEQQWFSCRMKEIAALQGKLFYSFMCEIGYKSCSVIAVPRMCWYKSWECRFFLASKTIAGAHSVWACLISTLESVFFYR